MNASTTLCDFQPDDKTPTGYACTRCGKRVWRSGLLADCRAVPRRKRHCAPCQKHSATEPVRFLSHPQAEICITHYQRPDDLDQLLETVVAFGNGWRTYVEDTCGNLSAGRNRLVRRTAGSYVILLEEDMRLRADSNLRALVDILEADPGVGVVCGCLNERGKFCDRGADLALSNGVLEITSPPGDKWRTTSNGLTYRHCDYGPNFFAARREVLAGHLWDERFELLEHAIWFWSLRQRGQWKVACTPESVVDHLLSRPTKQYAEARGRTQQFAAMWPAHYGFTRIQHKAALKIAPAKMRAALPNLVVLTVGHTNSSVLMRQLQQVGWLLGEDVDAEYGESRAVRVLNDQAIAGSVIAPAAAHRIVDALPTPWALKDPRFCKTLDQWMPAFADHKPVLLWLTKDPSQVEASWARRRESLDKLRDRLRLAEDHYARWPWQKLILDAEQLAQASQLFNPVLQALEIPRGQHRVWDETGPPMPTQYRDWVSQWQLLHPSWRHKMWGDAESRGFLDRYYPKIGACYASAKNPAAKSDCLRHAVIHRVGGVYLDVDFRPIKPIDELLAGCQAFAVEHRSDGLICAGVLGAMAGHPTTERILHTFPARWDREANWKTGPYLVDGCVRGHDDCRVLESRLFFPMDFAHRHQLDATTAYPGAYAVHHFAASWLPPDVPRSS